MRLTYDEVIDLLKRASGGRGADWNPDKHQMILFNKYGNYTYNKNRFDSLDLKDVEFEVALEIKEDCGMYECEWLTRKMVEKF